MKFGWFQENEIPVCDDFNDYCDDSSNSMMEYIQESGPVCPIRKSKPIYCVRKYISVMGNVFLIIYIIM